jgi:hypothetical protein
MSAMMRRLAGSGVAHGAFAFLLMGGWAFFANRYHPLSKQLLAAAVQGALSTTLTLFLRSAVDLLSRLFGGARALWAPPLIACLASGAVLVTTHILSGTPEVMSTIAFPLLVSTSYAAIYNYSIRRRGLAC